MTKIQWNKIKMMMTSILSFSLPSDVNQVSLFRGMYSSRKMISSLVSRLIASLTLISKNSCTKESSRYTSGLMTEMARLHESNQQITVIIVKPAFVFWGFLTGTGEIHPIRFGSYPTFHATISTSDPDNCPLDAIPYRPVFSIKDVQVRKNSIDTSETSATTHLLATTSILV